MQEGFKSLPKDLDGYLKMPKAVLASAARTKPKHHPTLQEAELLLASMPSHSLVDQRARAIFAIAYVGALRADTLISLRVKHFDIPRRLIFQDASCVRAKAGKSIDIFWFPIQKCFAAEVIGWVEALLRLGFTGEDALFPEISRLKFRLNMADENHKAVPVMSSTHAVTQAFAIACREHTVKFNPHSAKDTIGAERDLRPLTQLERKVWSENMGHDDEQTTDRYYGRLSDQDRFAVLENIDTNVRGDPWQFSDEDKIAFFDGMLELVRNR